MNFSLTRSRIDIHWLALLAAFLFSGIAGLIYESIWTHYLKLYLGHASYAQTLVLAVFMAGLALGSWLASKINLSGPGLLKAYAYTEIVIGMLGLMFHPGFVIFERWSFDTIIPQLDGAASVFLFKWGAALSLVAPQAILLGMTFPLMVAGILRSFNLGGGKIIASFYFVNSLGACIGVWLSGFWLISLAGLPGTLVTAAVINLLVGLLVLGIAGRRTHQGQQAPAERMEATESTSTHSAPAALLALCAAGTGLASFIYEISWIRMLNLVLGTTTHAFELMLGTFILGLALGSLAIRRYLDRLTDPIKVLGIVQIVMAIAATATILMYNNLFTSMAWLLQGLAKTESGYLLFNLSSLLICALVMLPATICAGMTLPLITHILRKSEGGEAVVGQVYAINTLGAIAGVVLVSALLIPTVGLKWALFTGVMVDLALGLVLLTSSSVGRRGIISGLTVTGMVTGIGVLVDFDPNRQVSGVYFRGNPATGFPAELAYYRDGPTASIGVKVTKEGIYTLLTNGKPDAALRVYEKNATGDEPTMVLLAAVPSAITEPLESAAIVGFGTGITSQSMLHNPELLRLDTIEIEPRMIDAAQIYRSRVAKVFDDPRSNVLIEDAKTFFSTAARRYDLIISEPSNPWVSGVAGLFSKEYYKNLRRYLNPDGVLTQWVHVYEFNDHLLISILRAMDSAFPHYEMYQINDGDVLVVASGKPLRHPDKALFQKADMRAELERIKIQGPTDLRIRYAGGNRLLHPWLARQQIPENSDYFPIVDLNAVKARYLETNSAMILGLREATMILDPQGLAGQLAGRNEDSTLAAIRYAREMDSVRQYLEGGRAPFYQSEREAFSIMLRVQATFKNCLVGDNWNGFYADSLVLAHQMLLYAPPTVFSNFWSSAVEGTCWDTYPEQMQAWLRFLVAVMNWNDKEISVLARGYLAEAGIARNLVLLSLLAADIRQEKFDESYELLEETDLKGTGLNIHLLATLIEHTLNKRSPAGNPVMAGQAQEPSEN